MIFGQVHPPQNYLFCDDGLPPKASRLWTRPDIVGMQVIYSWRKLEPTKGHYDFSSIQRDLATCRARHKRLFVQVQDRFFAVDARNIPKYVLTDSEFQGGLERQMDNPGEGVAQATGWVTKQWVAPVRNRFQRLLRALGLAFDGRIAGLNLPETAADVDLSTSSVGFTSEKYLKAEMDNMLVARRAFHHSWVVQYMNFWPGEWNNDHGYMEGAFKFAIRNHIGLGGPDIVPFRKGQMKNSYPFFHRYRGQIDLVAMAVQEPTLTYKNPATGKRFTKEEIVDFATQYLGANLIFWTPEAPWLRNPKE